MKFPVTDLEIEHVAIIARELAFESVRNDPNQIVAPLSAWAAGARSYSCLMRAILKVNAQEALVSTQVKTPRKRRKRAKKITRRKGRK